MLPLQAIFHVGTPLFISSLFYLQALLFSSSIIDLFTPNLCWLNSTISGNLCKEKRTVYISRWINNSSGSSTCSRMSEKALRTCLPPITLRLPELDRDHSFLGAAYGALSPLLEISILIYKILFCEKSYCNSSFTAFHVSLKAWAYSAVPLYPRGCFLKCFENRERACAQLVGERSAENSPTQSSLAL